MGKRRRAGVWGGLIGGLGLLVALLWAARHIEEQAAFRAAPSVFNETGGGLSAIYQALRQNQIPTNLITKPLSVSLVNRYDVLVFAYPFAEPVSFEDARKFKSWIARGGIAVFMFDPKNPFPQLGAELLKGLDLEFHQVSGVPFWRSFATGVTVPLGIRHPLLKGVRWFVLSGDSEFRISSRQYWVPLASDEFGIRVALRRIGKGFVVAADSTSLLANRTVAGNGDNLRFLINLISVSQTHGVSFVEYYHHKDLRRGVSWLLYSAGLAFPLLQVLLALILLGIALYPRMGDPVGTSSPRVETSPQLSRSIAELLVQRRATNSPELAIAQLEMFRNRVCSKLAIPTIPVEKLLDRLSRNPRVAQDVQVLKSIWKAASQNAAELVPDLLSIARVCKRIEQRLTKIE